MQFNVISDYVPTTARLGPITHSDELQNAINTQNISELNALLYDKRTSSKIEFLELVQTLCQQALDNHPDHSEIILALATYPQQITELNRQQIFSTLPSFVTRDHKYIELAKYLLQHGFQPRIAKDDLPFCTAEIKNYCKLFPYQTTKYIDSNLNGCATFKNNNQAIICRHLAMTVLETLNPDDLKISYKKLSSVENITQSIASDIEQRYENLTHSATECHLMSNERWGQFITHQFQTMELQKNNTRRLLLTSTNHAMATWLRIKTDKNGKKAYVIHFYDPNSTTTHTRAKTYDLPSITIQWNNLKKFLDHQEAREQFYYAEQQKISMVYVVPKSWETQSPQLNAHLKAPSHRELTSHDAHLDQTVMHHLMREGFADELRKLNITAISNALTVLAAKNYAGFPGLYMALQNGHTNVIRAYSELLKAVDISTQDLRELVAAKSPDGTPGLHIALQRDHDDTIKAYGELIDEIGIAGQDLLDLLAARRIDGIPGLALAFQLERANTVFQYCNLIDSFLPKLTSTQQLSLLHTIKESQGRKNSYGWYSNYAFYEHFKQRHPRTYRIFKNIKFKLKNNS